MKCHMENCDGDMVLTVGDDVTELSNGDKIVTPNITKEVCNKCGNWIISCLEVKKIEVNITAKYPDYFTKPRQRRPRLTI
jgi:hypothetical protein